LDAEDERIANLIVDGETDFLCNEILIFEGVKLTRPVRPQCNPGFCCGGAIDTSDGLPYETCQEINSTQVVYRPMRAKNATSRKPAETLEFACIDGAQKLAVAAVAIASSIFMLA